MIYKILKLCFYVIVLAGYCMAAPFDKIAVIVGNEIVLQSDMEELQAFYKSQPAFSEMKDDEVKQKILDKLIEDKVMLVMAKRDTAITVAPA